MSGSGKTLYVTSGIGDWVSVVDLRTKAVTDNIVVGTRQGSFLLIHDGQELWVSNEVPGQVSIIDRATNQVTGNLEFRLPGARLPHGRSSTMYRSARTFGRRPERRRKDALCR
jgi:YVTN family beta-propeller protein